MHNAHSVNCIVITSKDYLPEFEFAFKQVGIVHYVIVTNEEEFFKLKPSTDDLIFILAELQWVEQDRATSYLGFSVIKEIRYVKQWLNPIVICSAIGNKSFFLNQTGAQFKVLNLPHSHYFLEFPLEDSAFVELFGVDSPLRALTPNQLKDFVYHSFSARGLMDEELHKLKDQIATRSNDAINEAFNNIRHLIRINSEFSLDKLKAEMQERLSLYPNQALGLVTEFKPRIVSLLPQEDQETPIKIQVPWQVLFIDDNEYFRELLKDKLRECGLNCITAGSGAEAFQLLAMDAQGRIPQPEGTGYWPAHSITVLISDLRLLEPNTEEWQVLQGYDVIEQVFENHSHFLSFFVLTGKKTGVYQEYAQSKVKIQWFAKEDVLPPLASVSVFNAFVRQIEKAGDNIDRILCSVPTASTWSNSYPGKLEYPLKTYYRYHRLTLDYYEQENRINAAAAAYVEDVLQGNAKPQKYQFQAGQANGPEYQIEMDKFRDKLIGRRITWALHVKGYSNDKIQEAMRGSIAPDGGRQFFSTYLALSTNLDSLIPEGLLVEEKFFLEYFMGFPLNQEASPFLKELGQQLNKIRTEFVQKYQLQKDSPIILGHYEQVEDAILKVFNLAQQLNFSSDRSKLVDRLKKVISEFLQKSKYVNAIRASHLHHIYERMFL